MQEVIPKRLVYCWFGEGEMSDLNKRCMESWDRVAGDYELVRLDESTFDVESHPYSKMAYELGIWTLVTDVARLHYLRDHGGIYLDTDVELHRSPDWLRQFEGFAPMVDEGYFDVYMLGCGERFPKPYEAACGGMVKGEMTIPHMNLYLQENMPYLGEDLLVGDDGFALVGPGRIRWSTDQPLTGDVIATHHFERSWRAGGEKLKLMNVTTHTDILPFDMEDEMLQEELYGGAETVGWMRLESKPSDPFDIVGKTNYFYNPKVMEVRWDGGMARRHGAPEDDTGLSRAVSWSGAEILYVD